MSEQQENQKQENGKIRKKYENDLKNLTKVLGGNFLFSPTKLANSEVIEAVKELAKEEKEKLVKSFKERAVAAIQKQREHLKNVDLLKKEFLKKQEDSMKEFSKTVDGLFKDLEDIKNIEENYFNILMGKTASEEKFEEEKREEETPEEDKTE